MDYFIKYDMPIVFMDKKFMASLVVCFVALTMVAAGTYYIGQKKDRKTINVKKLQRLRQQ